ncbi:hypothetical protein JOQ06_019658 [Pogonophryne albipinna]|uniref:Uncharacterized protein n=1 Tax=Pogonophryne albipinna TaxID=1090488 RepID=A0AAD6BSF2_9TELE|nr:hypothetical protein JOQ06_019658 [Pogonophryne albipinna]
MLFKVQYQGKKKYIKQNGASYPEFLNEAKAKFSIPTEKNVYVVDDTGTEVDEEVFSDILEGKSDILWTIIAVPSVTDSPAPSTCTDTLSLSSQQHIDDSSSQAKELVKTVLEQKPGGEKIMREYAMRGEMKDRTRRNLVNILVADMVEKYGRAPPMDKRTRNTSFTQTAMRATLPGSLKTHSENSAVPVPVGGPELEREVTEEQQLEGDQCREAISLLKHSTDIEQICMKMRATFKHRQQLIHDPEQCSTVLTVFPRFLDTKGLVLQDFDLLFGAETSSKLLEKWGTLLKAKVMEQAKNLSKTPHLDYLIQCAEENPDEDEEVPGTCDKAEKIQQRKKPTVLSKVFVSLTFTSKYDVQCSYIFVILQSCRSLHEHAGPDQRRQPYIVAVGTTRDSIHDYYIAFDGELLPCKAKSSLSAFDELFKTHYVFGIKYDQALNGLYTFVQTTIFNIDLGLCHETPRVKDLRAKLLN